MGKSADTANLQIAVFLSDKAQGEQRGIPYTLIATPCYLFLSLGLDKIYSL